MTPIGSGLLPRVMLHDLWAAATFLNTSAPPREMGMRWSMVAPCGSAREACKRRSGNRRMRRSVQPLSKAREKNCAHCGKIFVARRVQRIYCYDSWCRQRAYQARKRSGEPLRVAAREIQCGECGETFTARHSDARWCSKLCANRHWGRVRSRGRQPLVTAPYADRDVFERDEWTCHLCGLAIDVHASEQYLRGRPRPN